MLRAGVYLSFYLFLFFMIYGKENIFEKEEKEGLN